MRTERLSDNWFSDQVMSPTEAAYMAGFVDGEGTITIVTYARKQSRIGFRYRPCFQMANTDIDGLQRIRQICGNGSIVSNFHRRKKNHRPVFSLRFTADQIRHVLPQLTPYLIVKRKQALILQAFLDLNAGWKWHQRTQEEWDCLEEFRARICALNQRGEEPKRFVQPTMRPSLLGNNQYAKTKTI